LTTKHGRGKLKIQLPDLHSSVLKGHDNTLASELVYLARPGRHTTSFLTFTFEGAKHFLSRFYLLRKHFFFQCFSGLARQGAGMPLARHVAEAVKASVPNPSKTICSSK
jgi:hypothetical protein